MRKGPLPGTLSVAAAVVVLLVCSGLACSPDASTDFSEVRELIRLEGDEYERFRDELLSERTEAWDQKTADAEKGDLGLAVFLFNARISDPDAFERLDQLHVMRARGGDLMLEWSDFQRGAAWQAYVVEHLWKDLWPEGVGWRLVEGPFLYDDFAGSPEMWRKYSTPSVDPLLRSIAVFALGKHPGFRELAAAVLAEEGDGALVKQSVFRALDYYTPDFATSLIVETRPLWQDDIYLQYPAAYYLAREAPNESRPVLYQWLHDDSLPPGMRLSVFEALTNESQARDVIEYKKLLESGEVPDVLRMRVTRHLEEEGP